MWLPSLLVALSLVDMACCAVAATPAKDVGPRGVGNLRENGHIATPCFYLPPNVYGIGR